MDIVDIYFNTINSESKLVEDEQWKKLKKVLIFTFTFIQFLFSTCPIEVQHLKIILYFFFKFYFLVSIIYMFYLFIHLFGIFLAEDQQL